MSEKVVPDTSILIDGKLSELLESGKLSPSQVLIPLAAVDELQAQASKGQEVGFLGLGELRKVQKFCDEKGVAVKFVGERPSLEDIKLARSGRIDSLIMDVAKNEKGILLTADYVQALVAEAKGIKVQYLAAEVKTRGLTFEKFFTPDTLSVHLKEGVQPLAKRGKPGKFKLEKLKEEPSAAEELEDIIKEIFEAAKFSKAGFVEISRSGASVIQLGNYRIAIARPPFSDGVEVTIVRPVVKLSLQDYQPSEKLMDRLLHRAEGIIIAGPPGSGKTTFASSLADLYMSQGKIVKTLESPRDLQVGPEITQYGPLEGDFEKTADILLLVRPDYTVFDEIRKTKDFRVFADMRLAGVGMIGVVHASDPISAIQRFVGRIELGMIPHIVDTLIFIKYGEIAKVYELDLVVKVPTGMVEEDLARPVVEVKDFETGELEYEIYTFGEENVVVPIARREQKAAKSGAARLAAERILQDVRRFDPRAEVEVVSGNKAVVYVEETAAPLLIGKNGATISRLEEKLGMRLDVKPRRAAAGEEVDFRVNETATHVELLFPKDFVGRTASVYSDEQLLFTATIGKKGRIKVAKRSELGSQLIRAIAERSVRIVA